MVINAPMTSDGRPESKKGQATDLMDESNPN